MDSQLKNLIKAIHERKDRASDRMIQAHQDGRELALAHQRGRYEALADLIISLEGILEWKATSEGD